MRSDQCLAEGFAGSRIGWAIVKDAAIAELMTMHVSDTSGYVQENQLRATHLLHHVLADQGATRLKW